MPKDNSIQQNSTEIIPAGQQIKFTLNAQLYVLMRIGFVIPYKMAEQCALSRDEIAQMLLCFKCALAFS
jgi:hypothetical protein